MASSLDILGVVDELKPEQEKYSEALRVAGEALEDGYNIFNEAEFSTKKGWKLKSDKNKNHKVYSKKYKFGKVYALKTIIEAPINVVFNESWNNFESTPTWDPTITFAKRAIKLTDHVDVVHYALTESKFIKSRDNLVARIWRQNDDEIYIASRSCVLPDYPATKDHVRANLLLGCDRYYPDKTNPNLTHYEYLGCLDIKSIIPTGILNLVMGDVILKEHEDTLNRYKNIMRDNRPQTVETLDKSY